MWFFNLNNWMAVINNAIINLWIFLIGVYINQKEMSGNEVIFERNVFNDRIIKR